MLLVNIRLYFIKTSDLIYIEPKQNSVPKNSYIDQSEVKTYRGGKVNPYYAWEVRKCSNIHVLYVATHCILLLGTGNGATRVDYADVCVEGDN